METVLITGGSGLVGKHLSRKLQEKGYHVSTIGRKQSKQTDSTYNWNINIGEIDFEAVEKADYIIHLAGANIGEKRWTNKRKKEILDSRTKSVKLILKATENLKTKPKAFISASAIGYYGALTSSTTFIESNPAANDFLGLVCYKWEEIADKFEDLGIRTVKIRTSIVLAKTGGALSKMLVPIKMGIGSPLGSGNQYMPWIHIDDLCNIYIKAIEDSNMEGAYNAVAPEQITNKEFYRKVAQITKKPFWFPNVPSKVLKIILGEMAIMLLNGSRISSDKIKEAGYKFLYPNLEIALRHLLK